MQLVNCPQEKDMGSSTLHVHMPPLYSYLTYRLNFYILYCELLCDCDLWWMTHFNIDIWWMDSTFYLLYDTHHRGAPKKEGFIRQQQQQHTVGILSLSNCQFFGHCQLAHDYTISRELTGNAHRIDS